MIPILTQKNPGARRVSRRDFSLTGQLLADAAAASRVGRKITASRAQAAASFSAAETARRLKSGVRRRCAIITPSSVTPPPIK